jgi:hypothetical protein
MEEKETITGFDIQVRPLTEEEATRDVTLERFNDFHSDAGVDFADTCGLTINPYVFVGFLMAKHPEWSHGLVDTINKGGDANSLRNFYIEENGKDVYKAEDAFYTDLAEFVNLTKHAKKRVNQILIQVWEYYNL